MAYRKGKTGRTIALVLCTILSVAAVAGAGTALYYGASENGWFSKEAVEEDNTATDESTETAGSLYVGESETTSNGIKLMSAKLLSSNLSESYTISVASYNETATSPVFKWSCSDETNVTISPSSDTKSCTVTLISAFSTAITITCTAQDNSSVYATCTVHYIQRLTDLGFSIVDQSDNQYGSIAWTSSGSSATWKFNSAQGAPSSQDDYDNLQKSLTPSLGTGSYKEEYTYTITYISNITGSSYTEYSSGKLLLANITGVSSSLSNNEFMASVYNALETLYESNTAAATFTITATGETSGLTSTYTYNLIINPVNFYVSVTSVSLDQTTIYF